MTDAKVLDPSHPIIELVWSGRVGPEDVDRINQKLSECLQEIGNKPFDHLVDSTQIITISPDGQKAIVEHQKWLLEKGMKRAAVITPNAVINSALDMIRSRSEHEHEYKFSSREEALQFLKNS